ncbi:type IV toxin-antitoxin system AbiEi family antitoxin domain-containing protein [Antrihabitans cavernicola]|uniref:DUF559 domain-containing protein n=1 Tax=Antrihabitans cavernicola TaxID=2495913 RepID=A0A5A7SDW8_9NOCA|nr:type IV toxin-antitoxin system AbiEi family antitoxin domain-containing protein [Spelaeibacter cavernicola]KAA0023744.1 DUF559 domain-containing protein [Spelaeibacter cavernicola]
MTPREIHRIMARQDGVISVEQALRAGMTNAAVQRRVSGGDWRRLRSGVYLRCDHAQTGGVDLRAAVLAAGEGAAACGPSAAWWHGLIDRPPRELWVTIPLRRSIARPAGVRIRRRDLHWSDLASHRGLQVTDLPLTVLEAAVVLPQGAALMDRALQRHTSLPILQATHERNIGRRGSAAATRLLTAAGEGGASEAERLLHRLLRRGRLTGWAAHVRSCGYEIDVAFIAHRVAIEVDGWAWHHRVDRFNSDRIRQNTLVNAGWRVLRFTWHQLHDSPTAVLDQIRAALSRQ